MDDYKLETFAGDSFDRVAEKAKAKASTPGYKADAVEFDFNGVNCLVNKHTNLEWLYRDYSNSWLMDWKTVGPNCVENYASDVQAEFEKRKKAQDEKRAIQEAEYKAKEQKEREAYEAKVEGISIELSDADGWQKGRDKNTDDYGSCIYNYAEAWSKLMQVEIANGKTVSECAEQTSHELGFYGITGFMYGAAVSILSQAWKHGAELKDWHNGKYNHKGEGVVNPAVLTIKA